MTISVVMPSYNQGSYLEESILSVVKQNYPRVELIVIDGGSSDESVDVIKRHSEHIKYWVSEKDDGQSDALNKGFSHANGDIIGWLNSDDTYEPGVFSEVEKAFQDDDVEVVMSERFGFLDDDGIVYANKENLYTSHRRLIRYWTTGGMTINQPCVFFRSHWLKRFQPVLDNSLHFAMDYDLWLRLSECTSIQVCPGHWANYRFHDSSKSGQGFDNFFSEWHRVSRRYWGRKYSAEWLGHWASYRFNKAGRRAVQIMRNLTKSGN